MSEKRIRQILIFQVGRLSLGMDVDYVSSIVRDQEITEIPTPVPNVLGITYQQGTCIPVFSLKKSLNLGKTQTPPDAVIITRLRKGLLALPIDGVKEISDLREGDLQGVPNIISAGQVGYLSNVASVKGQLISLVNPDHLISDEEKTALDAMIKKLENEKKD